MNWPEVAQEEVEELLRLDHPVFAALRAVCAEAPDAPLSVLVEHWPACKALASRHMLAAPLVRAVSRAVDLDPAHPIVEECRDRARRMQVRALFQETEFEALREATRLAGADCQILKGLQVARWAYDDIAARQLGDLDILVRPEHVAAVDRVIRDRGYVPEVDGRLLEEGLRDDFLVSHHVIEYTPPQGRAHLELHWRWVANPHVLPFAPEIMWGEDAAAHRTESFIYLCVHGGLHAWCRLKWLLDIHLLARDAEAAELDLERVARRAQDLRVRRWVGLALALSRAVFSTPLPAAWSPFAEAAPAGMLSRCLRIIQTVDVRREVMPMGWSALGRQLAGGDDLGRRGDILRRQIFTPSQQDLVAVAGAPRLRPILPCLRPALWLRRQLRRTG